MPLSHEQISSLLKSVASSTTDKLDCDRCFANVSQFAETELLGMPLCETMEAVKNHMANCPCCQDEFTALMAALKEIQNPQPPGNNCGAKNPSDKDAGK